MIAKAGKAPRKLKATTPKPDSKRALARKVKKAKEKGIKPREPAPPTTTFREDAARADADTTVLVQDAARKAFRLFLKDAHTDERLRRCFDDQTPPMILHPTKDWQRLGDVATGAVEDTLSGDFLDELVDGDGRVTVRRGIGKQNTLRVADLRLWVERKERKQIDITTMQPREVPLIRAEPWSQHKTGQILMGDVFEAKLSDDDIKEIKESWPARQRLLLRKKMRVQESVQEDPDDSIFHVERANMLDWCLAYEPEKAKGKGAK